VILDPAILALLAGSVLISFMVLYAGAFAAGILRRWDIKSGSEGQIALERKTYLVSTLLAYSFGFEILSFFLFIHTAGRISGLFAGAMCAAGSLNVNPFGYPTLILKLANVLAAGVWLVLNHVDSRAEDYPLIKPKYRFLLGLVPLVVAEAVLQTAYFLRLDPDIITSCCATLFSSGSSALPLGMLWDWRIPLGLILYAVSAAAIGSGLFFSIKGKGGGLFSILSVSAFAVSAVSVFGFISTFIYELPTHHCPFCILKKEYGYIGYPLYAALLGAVVLGAAVGVLGRYRKRGSLAAILPQFLRRAALVSVCLYAIFLLLATLKIVLSNLKIGGY